MASEGIVGALSCDTGAGIETNASPCVERMSGAHQYVHTPATWERVYVGTDLADVRSVGSLCLWRIGRVFSCLCMRTVIAAGILASAVRTRRRECRSPYSRTCDSVIPDQFLEQVRNVRQTRRAENIRCWWPGSAGTEGDECRWLEASRSSWDLGSSSEASSAVLVHRHAVCRDLGTTWQGLWMLPPLHGEDGVRVPCEALEPSMVLCAFWETPVERARGVSVLRVGLCGQIDELLVLDGGTRGTVPNTGSGLPGTRTGTALAAGSRTVHSSQWPRTRPGSHSREPLGFLLLAQAVCTSHRRTQALSQAAD